jgi:hypothetical protein
MVEVENLYFLKAVHQLICTLAGMCSFCVEAVDLAIESTKTERFVSYRI